MASPSSTAPLPVHFAGAVCATLVLLLGLVTGCPFHAEVFVQHCNSPKDCDDGNPCTQDLCTNTVCSNPESPKDASCPTGVCDGKGKCVECVEASANDNMVCANMHPTTPVCDAATQKCVQCLADKDCRTGLTPMYPNCDLKTLTCVSCHDMIKNEDETGVDCGGTHCGACQGQMCDAQGCGDGTFCANLNRPPGGQPENICCNMACNGKCQACTMKNSGGLDGTCTDVPLGMDPFMQCMATGTPAAGGCGATTGTCACEDMIQNGDETDVDCGGSACAGCGGGKKCKLSSDCGIEKPGNKPVCMPNGTCCESICNKTCESCNALGQCGNVPPGATDPNMLCPAGTVCGLGSAGCVAVTGAPCNPNFLGADCLSGSCSMSKKTCNPGGSGNPCNTNTDCTSGNCQNNTCL